MSADCARLTSDIDIDLKKVVKAGCQPSQQQIARMMDNPVGNLVFLALQNDYTWIKGPHSDGYKRLDRLQIMPAFPIKINEDWNLINRISIPFVSVPLNQSVGDLFGMSGGDIVHDPDAFNTVKAPFGRTYGLSDLAYVGMFSPAKSYKTDDGATIAWGLGAAMTFPTASHDVAGQGKFTAGPAGVVAYLGKDWTLGLFPQHFWSYAGDKNRADVSMTNIQYFIFRNIGDWRIGMAPNVTINWKATGGNMVTLPVGLGISNMTKIGQLPVRFGAEVQYSVIHPRDVMGSRWNFRIVIIPVIPTYLF